MVKETEKMVSILRYQLLPSISSPNATDNPRMQTRGRFFSLSTFDPQKFVEAGPDVMKLVEFLADAAKGGAEVWEKGRVPGMK